MFNSSEKRHLNDEDEVEKMIKKKHLDDEQDELSEEEIDGENEDVDENEEINNDDHDYLKIEHTFGICEYTSPTLKGFFGVIKQRISDFHVNEIDKNNTVVHFTNFDLPIIEKSVVKIDENQIQQIKDSIGIEKFNELNEFCNKNDKNVKFQLVAPKEKTDRKLLHDYIKTNFSNYTSNTIQNNKQEQLIEIYHRFYHGANTRDAYKRNEKIDFNYCNFVLYKENIDTLQAVNLLAKTLRIQPKRICYAGTKDKRAKTCQLMGIFKMRPDDILKVNDKCKLIKCGNFNLTNDALKLGELNGNRFTIVLRQVNGDNELIEQSIESLKHNGFINYYGLQRFGTTEIATHEIGKFLLKGNFKHAIDLILKPRKTLKEKDEIKKAREVWQESGDAKIAFKLIQYCSCLEKYLLRGLSECAKNDYLAAYNYIPRNMRLMYLHAYQSYVWNIVASERIKLFGLKPIVGDLVYDKTIKNTNKIIKLNENNLSSYEIDDVLLPLPGFNVEYPNNEIHNYYKTLLSTDGLDIDKLRNPIKEFSLAGDYRNIIVKPAQIEYEILYYKDPKTDLVLSDVDLLNDVKLNDVSKVYHDTDFPLKALILKFNLKTSCYATMALREILKLDTSQSYQSSLNNK